MFVHGVHPINPLTGGFLLKTEVIDSVSLRNGVTLQQGYMKFKHNFLKILQKLYCTDILSLHETP